MATINVGRLDDDVLQRLERRAASNNRSLESEARCILEGAVADDPSAKQASFLALIARLRRETGECGQTPSEILIREDRETGHRIVR